MVRLDHITYTYPRGENAALQDINLTVPEGQLCAVVGANGAGKSTLCYALTGFVPHFYKGTWEGTISIDGHIVHETPLAELAEMSGLVFADPFNQITGARFTVREEIAFGLENLGVPREEMLERTETIMELTGLSELADRSPMALSGGQQQRLALASVIVMRPRLLVLDEPTSQLDPVGTREVFTALDSLVTQGEMTIILVTHKLEWVAAFADRVLIMANGQIVADGSPTEVLAAADLADHGLVPTKYTQVARLAREREIITKEGPLPITLDRAITFFT